jgi:hypothetical protein
MTLRDLLATFSPAHRRWRALLASCDFVPESEPLDELGPRDVIVCGSPRSGTALATAALCQEPRSLAVMEPWDALRMPPARLFASLRTEIATGRLTRGRLDLARLRSDGSVHWCRDGGCPADVDLAAEGTLGVKFPAFWRYLDLLETTRFIVCVRHPVEVIESFGRAGGRLELGLDYDVPFNRTMNDTLLAATDDPALRRVLMYDLIHERVLANRARDNVFVLRYERWFAEPDEVLADLGRFLDVTLDQPRVVIEAPRSHHDADGRQADLVRERCRTAADLGYEL